MVVGFVVAVVVVGVGVAVVVVGGRIVFSLVIVVSGVVGVVPVVVVERDPDWSPVGATPLLPACGGACGGACACGCGGACGAVAVGKTTLAIEACGLAVRAEG